MAETLGQEVARRRGERGWSQTELAARAGVARGTVQHAEAGGDVLPGTRYRLRNALAADQAGGDAAGEEELAVLGELVAVMLQLQPGQRQRALAYLTDRFGSDGGSRA